MAVNPNIKKKADDIRNKVYGKEVRESLASGLEAMSSDVIENEGRQSVVEGRQDSVESQLQVVSDEMTDKDVISAPEIIAARDGEANLKARLDKENQEVAAQLAETEKLIGISSASISYGDIEIPEDFAEVPFSLWRDRDGLIKHDYDLEQYDEGDITIYVDASASNDSKDGLTPETANRSIIKGLDIALARPEKNIMVKIINGGFFSRERGLTTEKVVTDKRITLSTFDNNKTFWAGNAEVLTWTKTVGQSNIYQADRTNSSGILDKRKLNLDHNGIPKPYIKVDSIAECENTEGSWFFASPILYTHPLGGVEPDNEDIFGLTRVASFPFKLVNSTLVVKNAVLYNGGTFNGIDVSGDINSRFIMDNCKVAHSNYFNDPYQSISNGVAVSNVGQTLLFNVTTAYGNRDGFNYHYTGIPLADRRKCLAFEYNCTAYDYGVHDLGNTNDNATTMHEGACILRVGTIGYRTRGPVLADVNSSYSINYDTHMRDSLAPSTANSGKNKVAMKFHTGGASISEVGKTILVNCSGGGDVNWGLYRDGDVDTEFIIQGFKGEKSMGIDTVHIVK